MIASQQQVTFFCMDVTCKFVPYLQKVTSMCPQHVHLIDLKPFLSVMHAKAHDVKCEVNFFVSSMTITMYNIIQPYCV